jgi:UDP-N-acetyl-alpha-D-muramoyl-L-alanyl-L-glutamate epimerase
MTTPNSAFIFKDFSLDSAAKQARFVYAYEGGQSFEEILTFDTPAELVETPEIRQLLFDLHIALGMSYWKAYVPKEIRVESGELTSEDAAFWNTVYTKGLGEFFYQNQIDFRDLVNFPSIPESDAAQIPQSSSADEEHKSSRLPRTLVPLGGGKDSLTTVMLLEKMQIPFETVALGEYAVVEKQVKILGTTHHRVHRQIDPALFELNKGDAYNGHVPISVIYALTSLLIAAWNQHRAVVLSNEASANVGNVEYLGEEVNHQWSKSFEFETLLREHLARHRVNIDFFSLLRPLNEYAIAELFAQTFEKWKGTFTSCNRNFTQAKQQQTEETEQAFWCGECPKCLFVFTMLGAWINKPQLVEATGINPWENAKNEQLLKELLGLENIKPFECVGTPEEMIAGCEKLFARGEYRTDALMKIYMELRRNLPIAEAPQRALQRSAQHHIPTQFQQYLHELNS